jgi:hypothetical protein
MKIGKYILILNVACSRIIVNALAMRFYILLLKINL